MVFVWFLLGIFFFRGYLGTSRSSAAVCASGSYFGVEDGECSRGYAWRSAVFSSFCTYIFVTGISCVILKLSNSKMVFFLDFIDLNAFVYKVVEKFMEMGEYCLAVFVDFPPFFHPIFDDFWQFCLVFVSFFQFIFFFGFIAIFLPI